MSSHFVALVCAGLLEDDLGWLISAPWGKSVLVVVVALLVLAAGNALLKRKPWTNDARHRPDFDLEVARLESLPVSEIASARKGPVHLEGSIASAVGSLGGDPGRECVYRNRVGAGRGSAVGSELILVRDGSGQVGIENLEHARVVAPRERADPRAPETYSLHVGDHVEVLGEFTIQPHGDDTDPRDRVYGMLGADRRLQVRVLERAPKSTPTDKTTDP